MNGVKKTEERPKEVNQEFHFSLFTFEKPLNHILCKVHNWKCKFRFQRRDLKQS